MGSVSIFCHLQDMYIKYQQKNLTSPSSFHIYFLLFQPLQDSLPPPLFLCPFIQFWLVCVCQLQVKQSAVCTSGWLWLQGWSISKFHPFIKIESEIKGRAEDSLKNTQLQEGSEALGWSVQGCVCMSRPEHPVQQKLSGRGFAQWFYRCLSVPMYGEAR